MSKNKSNIGSVRAITFGCPLSFALTLHFCYSFIKVRAIQKFPKRGRDGIPPPNPLLPSRPSGLWEVAKLR